MMAIQFEPVPGSKGARKKSTRPKPPARANAGRLLDADGVLGLLVSEVEKAGGAASWAKAHRVSARPVQMAIAGHRGVTPAILEALGLRAVTMYRRES